MKKLIISLILCLTASAFAQWSGIKPMLGRQIDYSHPLSDFVGAWFMPEGSGTTVADLSGNGNTGTGTLTWAGGKFGSYVTSGAITVPDSPVLDGYSTMSWSLWINIPSSGAVVFLDKYVGVAGKRSWQIARKADADLTLQISDDGVGNELQEFQQANLATGVWQHLVVTFDNGTGLLYKNGVFIDTVAFLADLSIFGGSADFIFDCSNQELDVPMIYNRALTASEIQQLYREPFCMFKDDLTVAMMYDYSGAPAPTGQVIMITSAIPILAVSLLWLNRKKAA